MAGVLVVFSTRCGQTELNNLDKVEQPTNISQSILQTEANGDMSKAQTQDSYSTWRCFFLYNATFRVTWNSDSVQVFLIGTGASDHTCKDTSGDFVALVAVPPKGTVHLLCSTHYCAYNSRVCVPTLITWMI